MWVLLEDLVNFLKLFILLTMLKKAQLKKTPIKKVFSDNLTFVDKFRGLR